jgi:membrane protease YdiL (CAAX protease family)
MARFRSSTIAGHEFASATVILGLLWGLWHVPLYGPLGFVVPLLLALFYTYLFNRTGSVIPCLVLHGSFTAAQDHLTLLAHEVHGVTDAAIGISYLVAALALVLATRGRLGKQVAAQEPRTRVRMQNRWLV